MRHWAREDKLIKYLFSFDVNDGFVEGRKSAKKGFWLKGDYQLHLI